MAVEQQQISQPSVEQVAVVPVGVVDLPVVLAAAPEGAVAATAAELAVAALLAGHCYIPIVQKIQSDQNLKEWYYSQDFVAGQGDWAVAAVVHSGGPGDSSLEAQYECQFVAYCKT